MSFETFPEIDLSSDGPTLKSVLHSTMGGRLSREDVRARACSAMERKLPHFLQCENKAKEWAIIGGGPSINNCVQDILRLKKRGVNIVSVNKSHDWLLEKGIVPWGHFLLDPKDWVADYVKRPRKDVRYFVASQCHDSVFESLKAYPVFLWHAGQDFPQGDEPTAVLRQYWPTRPWHVVPGATTVGLRSIMPGHFMGADKFHLFGFDSSRSAGKLHAYHKIEAKDAQSGPVLCKSRGYERKFDTNSHMARQYFDFDRIIEELPIHTASERLRPAFTMTVYGHGLLPFYAATIGLHANEDFNKDPMKVGGYLEPLPANKFEIPKADLSKVISIRHSEAA